MAEKDAVPALLGIGPFDAFQCAYTTTDLDEAMRRLGALYGIPSFQVSRDVQIDTSAGPACLHFALAFLGNRQIEIIQPAGGHDATYRQALPDVGFGVRIHHLGRLITSPEDWQAVVTAVEGSGLEVPVRGEFCHEGVALMHYLYCDTRASLGHHLEFMYQTPEGRDMFAQVPRYGT